MKTTKTKAKFAGACDRFRAKSKHNEMFWHEMMQTKQLIARHDLVAKSDVSSFLDDETIEQYWADNPDALCFESTRAFFIQIAGFEFIFLKPVGWIIQPEEYEQGTHIMCCEA